MISSYEIAVAGSPSESITNYTAISDCRCNYSITVPVTIESQYSVSVSSVNSVGSNSESTTFGKTFKMFFFVRKIICIIQQFIVVLVIS